MFPSPDSHILQSLLFHVSHVCFKHILAWKWVLRRVPAFKSKCVWISSEQLNSGFPYISEPMLWARYHMIQRQRPKFCLKIPPFEFTFPKPERCKPTRAAQHITISVSDRNAQTKPEHIIVHMKHVGKRSIIWPCSPVSWSAQGKKIWSERYQKCITVLFVCHWPAVLHIWLRRWKLKPVLVSVTPVIASYAFIPASV